MTGTMRLAAASFSQPSQEKRRARNERGYLSVRGSERGGEVSLQCGRQVHGIVLAGAYPKGVSRLDDLVPRPLLPVAQQPLIAYSLRWLRGGDVNWATICTNSAAREVQTRLGSAAFGVQLDYQEDWSPRGTAGCLKDAGSRTDADTLVVADGTAIPMADIGELLAAHDGSRATVTIVVGADAWGRLCPTGVYLFDRSSLHFIPDEGFYDIKERLIPRLHAAGENVSMHLAPAAAPRAVDTEGYLALNHWAVERGQDHLNDFHGFRRHGRAVVHATASVDSRAMLLGPVLVGPGVSVEPGATLVGPVTLGQGTVIGEGAVVSRSVVWDGCEVATEAFVDRSMLGTGARVSPGAQVISTVQVKRERKRTRRRDFGFAKGLWGPLAAAPRPAAPQQP